MMKRPKALTPDTISACDSMLGLDRRGKSSSVTLSRISPGSTGRSGPSRGPRVGLAALRRSARISGLLAICELEATGAQKQEHQIAQEGLLGSHSLVDATASTLPVRPQYPADDFGSASHSRIARDVNSTRICSRRLDLPSLTTSRMNGELEPPSDQYTMNIVIEPSNHARPGQLLSPPLVLSFEYGTNETNEGRAPDDYTLLWAVVSIVGEDSTTPIAPPQPHLLSGTPVDSIHPLTPGISGREVGYVSFTDLAIREPGRYRLQVSLIRMNTIGGPSATQFEGGVNLQQTSTRVINVVAGAQSSILGSFLCPFSVYP